MTMPASVQPLQPCREAVIEIGREAMCAVEVGARPIEGEIVRVVINRGIGGRPRVGVGGLKGKRMRGLLAQGELQTVIGRRAGKFIGRERRRRFPQDGDAQARVLRGVRGDAVAGHAIVPAVDPGAGRSQQGLIEAARQEELPARGADVAGVERETAEQAKLCAEVPLVQARDNILGTGHTVGELRRGSSQYVPQSRGGKGILEAGEVVARIRVCKALGEGRRGELRKPGRLVEETVASAHRKPAARAERLPGEAEAWRHGIERRRVAVLAACGAHQDAGGRRAERLARIRVEQAGVIVGRHRVAGKRAGGGRNRPPAAGVRARHCRWFPPYPTPALCTPSGFPGSDSIADST